MNHKNEHKNSSNKENIKFYWKYIWFIYHYKVILFIKFLTMKKIFIFSIFTFLLLSAWNSFAWYWWEPWDWMDNFSIQKDCKLIDSWSYTTIQWSWGKDKNWIYYWCDKVDIKDPATFEVISWNTSHFAKDKYNVYIWDIFNWVKKLERFDVNTIQYLDWYTLAIDKNNLICSWIRYEWVDWLKIKASYSSDKKYISDWKRIFLLWDWLCEEIIWVDAKTWKVIFNTDQFYSSDKNSVYHNNTKIKLADPKTFKILDTDTNLWNYWVYGKDKKYVYWNWVILEWADTKTFKYIDYSFAKDKKNVYWDWFLLKWIDIKTFKIINTLYISDKNWVYSAKKYIKEWEKFDFEKIIWADPKTFNLIGGDYAKDKKNVYFWNNFIIKWADTITFKADEETWYGWDKNNTYYLWNKINWSDWKSFYILYNSIYGIDKNNVYFSWVKINWADPQTFNTIFTWSNYAKDKNHVYFTSRIIEGADPTTFEIIYKDKNWTYVDWNLVK